MMMQSIQVLFALFLCVVSTVQSFATHSSSPSKTTTSLSMVSDNQDKPKNIFADIKGMFNNFDDVVDDFLFKRMGAGEQWYGKRKYSPSGKFDGDYNGMGRSDLMRIEIAKVQKEEMEKRRQRREEEEEAKKN